MKVLMEIKEDGLETLMGKKVILFCANYFYTGKLVGVNKTVVKLEDAAIVYETGPFTDSKYKDEQPIGKHDHYVRIPAIESFGLAK